MPPRPFIMGAGYTGVLMGMTPFQVRYYLWAFHNQTRLLHPFNCDFNMNGPCNCGAVNYGRIHER